MWHCKDEETNVIIFTIVFSGPNKLTAQKLPHQGYLTEFFWEINNSGNKYQ